MTLTISTRKLMIAVAISALAMTSGLYLVKLTSRAQLYSRNAATLERFEKAEREEAERFAKSSEKWTKEIRRLEEDKKSLNTAEQKRIEANIKICMEKRDEAQKRASEMWVKSLETKKIMNKYKKAATEPWFKID